MKSVLLIALMIVIYTAQSLFCKKYTDSYPGKAELASPTFTAVSGALVVLVSLCFAGFSFSAGWQTLVFGIANGAVLFSYNFFMVKSSRTGSYSILMVFMIAGGIVVPAIVAPFFGDRVSVPKLLAILVVLCSVYLVSYRKGESGGAKGVFWLYCIALAACNGAYGVLLDVQQRVSGAGEKEEMVALTYATAALISLAVLLSRERGSLSCFRQTRASLPNLLISSASVALAINLLVLVLPHVNTTVLYTINNASVFLLSVICSALLFRDKLSRLNIVGCGVMCAALVAVAVL